jgi:hypothetical protein
VLVLLILGVAFVIGFVAWEGYCKHPMMPLYIWKDRNFSLVSFIILCAKLNSLTVF